MEDRTKLIFRMLLLGGVILLVILVMQPLEVWFFSHRTPLLFPKGAIALKERNLLLFIQVLMLFVIVPVYIFTFAFSWWYRADNKKAKYDPHLVDHKLAEVIWWGLPAVMLTVVAYITWIKTYELDPYRPLESESKPLKIEAVALNWKWLFIYPDEGIASVSYLRVPKGRPLHFFITADAPMNSLWIPGLGGQIYAMPGMQTQLHLIADEEGEMRGGSANISGEGFARMTFTTDATSEEEFSAWVEALQQSDRTLDLVQYNELAKPTIGHAVEEYRLTDPHLFHTVLMKYMKPAPKN